LLKAHAHYNVRYQFIQREIAAVDLPKQYIFGFVYFCVSWFLLEKMAVIAGM